MIDTSTKIADLLNRAPLTIQEVATELGISRNSAHQQIRKLEAAGVIEKQELRMSNTAGKPAYRYQTAAGQEDVNSTAYKPVLDVLMQALSAGLPENKRLELFENSGRALAKASDLKPGGDTKANIEKAVDAVNALGAMAEYSRKGRIHRVSCHSCPVATMVHREPLTCSMVAAFFAEATGKKVTVECKKEHTVVCGFKFS